MNNPAVVQAESPSRAVIEEVAASEGVEPADLETPLYEAIDPDALNALLGGPSRYTEAPLYVEFTYAGYDVRVSSEGAVSVSRRE